MEIVHLPRPTRVPCVKYQRGMKWKICDRDTAYTFDGIGICLLHLTLEQNRTLNNYCAEFVKREKYPELYAR